MISSLLRLAVGFVYMVVATTLFGVLMLLLLPWRNLRIRACNYWGWVSGGFCLWLSGSRFHVEGKEHLDGGRPCIYVSNHTSTLDIFLGIHISPVGTVGVAKKEVVYYPFFGQLYLLSGHLRIDRGNHERAMAAMQKLQRLVKRYELSIWMWPEGTRSRDGRLLPFKKGIVHLAVGVGLPVVPVVVSGAQSTWKKGTVEMIPADVRVQVLPAIDTSGWKDRPVDEVLAELHALFVAHLPEEQRPLAA